MNPIRLLCCTIFLFTFTGVHPVQAQEASLQAFYRNPKKQAAPDYNLEDWLRAQVTYPIPPPDGYNGTIYLKVIIDSNGRIQSADAINGSEFGPGIREEAERIVRLMPRWQPAMDKGSNVMSTALVSVPYPFPSREPGRQKIYHMPFAVEITTSAPYDFSKYIQEHLQYPKELSKANVRVKCTVYFTISSDGSVTDVYSKTGNGDPELGRLLADEAERVIRTMPKWSPAIEDGHTKSTKRAVPVVFQSTE